VFVTKGPKLTASQLLRRRRCGKQRKKQDGICGSVRLWYSENRTTAAVPSGKFPERRDCIALLALLKKRRSAAENGGTAAEGSAFGKNSAQRPCARKSLKKPKRLA
jgi:hypothetical protein